MVGAERSSRSCVASPVGNDEGSALVMVLMIAAIVAGIGLAMSMLSDTEIFSVSAHRDGLETFYAVDGALEVLTDELAQMPDWSPALSGAVTSRLTSPSSTPTTPLAGAIDLAAMTTTLQAQSDLTAAWGANNPRWVLFGAGLVSAVWPSAGGAGDIYVVAWLADDVGESDGNPWQDSNGVIRLHVEGVGRRGTRRGVESVLGRAAVPGIVRQLSWREVQ